MRDYAKVSPQFWTGPTGRAIRADGPETLIVAFYLMTAPASTMSGLFYLPITTVAHETGLSHEGASKALARVCELGFADYYEPLEVVWVVEMARHQLGETISTKDLRHKGLLRELYRYDRCPLLLIFWERYGAVFSLPQPCPFKAPSKPLRSRMARPEVEQETEQEKETETEKEQQHAPFGRVLAARGVPLASTDGRGKRIPADWQPSDETIEWTHEQGVDGVAMVEGFVEYWLSIAGARGRRTNWDLVFKNRVREEMTRGIAPALGMAPVEVSQIEYSGTQKFRVYLRGGRPVRKVLLDENGEEVAQAPKTDGSQLKLVGGP